MPKADITFVGESGSRFSHFAFRGSAYSPGETGWVLVIDNAPEAIDPQALSAAEVLGDLRSMMPSDSSVPVMVEHFTDEMISALERGDAAPARHADEPDAAERLDQLREERRAAFGE